MFNTFVYKFFLILIYIITLSSNKVISDPVQQEIISDSFILEMVFIVKEHSLYAKSHPENLENLERHLKHSCHALDPKLVKERPMPAPEIGLLNALNSYLKYTNTKNKIIIKGIKLTNDSIKMCKSNLYSKNIKELQSLSELIFFNYSNYLKALKLNFK